MAKRDPFLSKSIKEITVRNNWEKIFTPHLKQFKKNGDWLNTSCPLPSHVGRDTNPSFGVNVRNGTYHCFVCGSGDAIDFLVQIGGMSIKQARSHLIEESGLQKYKSNCGITAEDKKRGYFISKRTDRGTLSYIESYIYSENGKALYRKNRYEGISQATGKRSKQFDYWVRQGDDWIPGGKNLKITPQMKVLYRQEMIEAAEGKGAPIYLCEGEKDVNIMVRHGFFAVTAGGVNDWQQKFASRFTKCEVILIPDNDTPGRILVKRIANDLTNAGVSFRILNWKKASDMMEGYPGVQKDKHGEDLSDFIGFFCKQKELPLAQAVQCAMEVIHGSLEEFKMSSDQNIVVNDSRKKHIFWDFPLNDVGNTARFIHLFGIDIRYCPEMESWFYWNGYWQVDKEGHLMTKVRELVAIMLSEADKVNDTEFKKYALRCGNLGRLKAILEIAKHDVEHGIPRTAETLDTQDGLICIQDCTIDMKLEDSQAPFEVREHQREDYITKQLSFCYSPIALCTIWCRFLHQILPDEEIQKFIQRAVGYCLTGDTREDKLFILYGSGSNGKSTFVEVIAAMLGDYAKTIRPDTLMLKDGNNGLNTEIANIRGARFVRTSEADEGKRLSESMIKLLTGGESVSTRFLYGPDFEYRPTYKIWFSTNHYPIIRGADRGIWRRIILIPFHSYFSEENCDRNIGNELLKELPGIFNWALEGMMAWKKTGLNPPKSVVKAVEDYRHEQDVVGQFLLDCVVENVGERISAKKLYEAYKKYCEQSGVNAISATLFGLKMSEKGYSKKKTCGNHYYMHLSISEGGTDCE